MVGQVHRDIKPANILLEDGVERVAITDFGLARAIDDATITRTGVIAGTPQYMSPEQARGESVNQRSDLFSLGAVLYAMCTGRSPFRAETSYGVLRRIGLSNEQIDQLAERNKASGGLTLFAPSHGIVTAKEVHEGEHVASGTRLFTIADPLDCGPDFMSTKRTLDWPGLTSTLR